MNLKTQKIEDQVQKREEMLAEEQKEVQLNKERAVEQEMKNEQQAIAEAQSTIKNDLAN